MKGLVNCRPPAVDFSRQLRVRSPYLLPVCNQPLLKYVLDLFHALGVRSARIVLYEGGGAIEGTFGTGERLGIEITYMLGQPEDDLAATAAKNRGFLDDDVIVADGHFLALFDKRSLSLPGDLSEDRAWSLTERRSLAENLFVLPAASLAAVASREVLASEPLPEPIASAEPIPTLRRYFDLNLDVLSRGAQSFELPGYSNEAGAYVGMNVVLSPQCTIEKPVMIGSNSQIGRKAALEGRVILGPNVLVGARTHLRDTVVLDGTYIGEDLEIVRKIIAGRRVTDPDTGVSVDVLEQFLVSELHGSPVDRLRKRAVGILVSLPVLALQLPLFLLLRAGVEHERARYYGDADGRELVTERYFKSGRIGLLQRLFFRLSLDGVPLLLKVLSGQLVFSGNRLAPADAEGLATLEELPSYAPGAFSYSDLIGSEPEQWLIDDLYYASHRSVWLDLKIFFGTLVNRLLSPGEPR